MLSTKDMECYPTKMGRCFYWGLNLVVVPHEGGPKAPVESGQVVHTFLRGRQILTTSMVGAQGLEPWTR